VAKPPSTSPPLTTDGVDKMYHQLVEIHAITTAQLVESSRRRCSDSTPSLLQCLQWQGWCHHHLLTSHPEPYNGGRAGASNPRPTVQARQGSAVTLPKHRAWRPL
jgi:hypothetical protein